VCGLDFDGITLRNLGGGLVEICHVQAYMIALSNKKQNRLPKILEHASGDKRFKILEAHMKKHQFNQDA